MGTRGTKGITIPQTEEQLPQVGGSVASGGRADEFSRQHVSYGRLFFFLILSIFLAEVAAMGLIHVLPPLPYQYTTLIDAGVMTALIFPLLYFLSFRPLILHIQKRQEAESTVRQLSSIVEQTEDTVVVTDCSGVIEYVNPAFERLTGFTRNEVIGKRPNVLKSGLHPDEFYRNLWETVLRGEVFQSEIANHKKNGELFYEVKTITPLRPETGIITHFVATGKDITEHKQDEEKLHQAYNDLEFRIEERTEELRIAISELEDEIRVRRLTEEALRNSEQMLKRAQEIAHLGSWELDLLQNELTWSDEVYRIFGLQPQEFGATYEAFLEAVHPDDRAAVNAAYAGSIHDGKDTYEIEHRIVRQSSEDVRIVHEKCEHFRNEEGQIIRSVGMVHDVTEHRHAEEQLHYQAALLSNVNDAIVASDAQFRLTAWNSAAESLYGWKAEEVIGRIELDIMRTEWPERDAQEMRRTIAETGRWRGEATQVRKDGTRFPVEVSSIVLRDGSGQPSDYISVNRDITARKQAEEALREAHAELEKRVQERTAELAVANQELVREIAERKEIERQLRIQTTAMESAANGIVITDCLGNIQWANPAMTQISGYAASNLSGKHTRIFNSGEQDESYYREMWETILSGRVWRGETINRRRDGTQYVEEQTITPVRGELGQVTHFIAIKQDISERKRAERELELRNVERLALMQEEREQRQFAEALVKAVLVLNKSLKLNEVLAHILEQIREVIPYEFANIVLLEGETFYDASHQGEVDRLVSPYDSSNRFPLTEFPLLTKMIQTGQPILIEDTSSERDWVSVRGLDWSRSFLSTPLLVEEQVIGFVNLFASRPDFFTQAMRNRLAGFAVQAAVAIQNAWLFEQVRASTERLQSLSRRLVEIQENERLYISRELHDEAGQVLTSLLVDLRLLEKKATQPDDILKIVSEMERSLNGVIENLHRIAMALRPASLDHVGLVAALRQHVESVGEKHGIQARFRSSGGIARLPANAETILYRTVQEALTNVVRHARATRVDVVLTVRDGKLVVLVEDDGVGFDPNTVDSEDHLGLFGIRERAEMIGATLLVESEPGRGTTIMMEVEYADTTAGSR